MNFRRVIYIFITVTVLLMAHALPALQAPAASQQAPSGTKAGARKAKKTAKDVAEANGRAGYPATDTDKRARVKPKKTAAPETAKTRSAASSSTETTKETTGRADRMTDSATDTSASAPAKIVSDSEIAAAKASRKVWVNTESGTYHKGGRWYGATKQGKFMAEQDAIRAGYHAARGKSQ